jgi:hypothetical protein
MVMLAALFPLALASSAPAQANEKNCSAQILDRQREAESRIDKQKALSLARAAKNFESATKGYTASFHSIYFIHSFDPVSCDYRGIDSVNVVHALSNKGKHVKNFVVHLDPKLERATGSTEQMPRLMAGKTQAATNWSGYSAAIKNSTATRYRPLNYVTANWMLPKISSPDTGDTACVEFCDVSVWVSLQPDQFGTNIMAQAGTLSYRTCNWSFDSNFDIDLGSSDFGAIDFKCSNEHGFMYDFMPYPIVQCGDVGTVKTGDSVTAYVVKKIEQGGNPTSTYTVSIADNTTGKSCSATVLYSMSNAYYASWMAETSADSQTGVASTLPTFSDIMISGALVGWFEYDGAASYQKYYLNRVINSLSPNGQADYFKYLMYGNSRTQNIALGSVSSSGTFIQQYLTSEK